MRVGRRGERIPRINATARPGGQNLRIPAGYIDATRDAIHDRGVIVDLKRTNVFLSLRIPFSLIEGDTSDQIQSIFRGRIAGKTRRASSVLAIIKSIRAHQVI